MVFVYLLFLFYLATCVESATTTEATDSPFGTGKFTQVDTISGVHKPTCLSLFSLVPIWHSNSDSRIYEWLKLINHSMVTLINTP